MSITLRPYLRDIINELRSLMLSGQKNLLVCSPTGSGKTALAVDMLGSASKKGVKSFFIVHRRELIKQSVAAFERGGVEHGVIASGFHPYKEPLVQVASIQTLVRRLDKQETPGLIIWDECHHVAAGSWTKVFGHYPNAFHIGLTATPERLDGKGLDPWFNVIVHGPSVAWLIENGFLVPYRLYCPGTVSMEGVKTQMGDYKKSEVNELVDKPTITGSCVKEYKRLGMGKRAVIFCASVKHSEHVVAQFNASGVEAIHVDGETNHYDRDTAIKGFTKGDIKVLSNVDLFGEGFDLPAIELIFLLRPTQSLGLYLQQIGRALRTSPGKKEAIILDHVGNVERHLLPDTEREWSLEGRAAGKGDSMSEGIGIRICAKCFAAQLPGSFQCKYCGFKFEIKERKIEEVEGELVEIDQKTLQLKKRVVQGMAQTKEELIELGKKRGYARPRLWAEHVWKSRRRRT